MYCVNTFILLWFHDNYFVTLIYCVENISLFDNHWIRLITNNKCTFNTSLFEPWSPEIFVVEPEAQSLSQLGAQTKMLFLAKCSPGVKQWSPRAPNFPSWSPAFLRPEPWSPKPLWDPDERHAKLEVHDAAQNKGGRGGEKGREGKVPDICLTGPRHAMPSC